MGGGQLVRSLFSVGSGINLAQVPGMLKSTVKIVIDYVMRLACFIWIAGFQSDKPIQFTLHIEISYRHSSAAFSMWASKLFKYYCELLGEFYLHYPNIKKNFYNSIFACCTFNFGPHCLLWLETSHLAGVQSWHLRNLILSGAVIWFYGTYTGTYTWLSIFCLAQQSLYALQVFAMAIPQFNPVKIDTQSCNTQWVEF